MEKKKPIVLCVSNAYQQKFYWNSQFDHLPDLIKKELKIVCVLYTEEIGGILSLEFGQDGKLIFRVAAEENDFFFDEIGSALKIKEIQSTRKELLEKLEEYCKIFFLEKGKE